MSLRENNLSLKTIFVFWLPLAVTWWIMSIEGPFLAAIIARLADEKHNLAAFGVAFSLAIIVEAPIIMIMSAATALAKGDLSSKRLFRYTLLLNAIITLIMLMLIIPPVFSVIVKAILGLPDKVGDLCYAATLAFLPWPAAIGFRRFYQGILINANQTRKVAYGTVIRLGSIVLVASLLYAQGEIPGALLGAAALSFGVVIEAIASFVMALGAVRKLRAQPESHGPSYTQIHRFYFPLALTSILTLAAHPIATFFLGQSRMALDSLALMPVLNSLVFIFRSIGLSYQEVVIAKAGQHFEHHPTIKKFALLLGISTAGLLVLVAFTPLLEVWYRQISGLSPDMVDFGRLPTRILAIIPGLTVWISLQRGVQVIGRQTQPVTIATAIELVGIVLCLFVGIKILDLVGAVAAAIAFIIGRLAAIVFLIPYNRRLLS